MFLEITKIKLKNDNNFKNKNKNKYGLPKLFQDQVRYYN